VLGLLDATLQDENRAAQALPVPALLKVGDVIDGLVVTAAIADNGINVVCQAKVQAPASDADADKRYVIKALHPPRAHDREEKAMLAHEAWLAKRMQSSRAADNLVNITPTCPVADRAAPSTCSTTGTAAKR
jgi:hypothetical protein